MGTFEGHVLPGVVLVLFGVWHVIQFSRKYFREGKKFSSNTYYPNASCISSKLPCESVIKILATTIHFTIEFITGYTRNGKFGNYGNLQHMALVSLFWVQAVIEILVHNRVNVPGNINYVAIIIAFIFEAFVFSQHIHGREMVDTQMHIAVIILALTTALLLALEMRNRESVTLVMVTRYVIILQGSWLVEMGFVIFPPTSFKNGWSLNDHGYNEVLSASLGFQAGIILLLVLIIWLFFAIINGQFFKEDHGIHHFDEKRYALLEDEEEQNVCEMT